MEKKYKKLWICLAGGIAVFIVGMIVLAVVLLKDNGDDTDSDRKKKDNDVVVTGEAVPTDSRFEGIADAGKGRFAEMAKILCDSKQYSMTVSYSYDIGDGERVEIKQNLELNGNYWYTSNACNTATGESLDDSTFLYDLSKHVMYDMDEKVAVEIDEDSVRPGGVFAEVFYYLQQDKDSLIFLNSSVVEKDGSEVIVEVYSIKDNSIEQSLMNLPEKSHSSSNTNTERTLSVRNESVQLDKKDYEFKIYFDKDGNLIGFENGKLFFYVQLKQVSFFSQEKELKAIADFEGKAFEEYVTSNNISSPVQAHVNEVQTDELMEEEIIKLLKRAQEKYKDVALYSHRTTASYKEYLSDCFTPELVDRIVKNDRQTLDEISNDDSWSSWCYVGATGFWSVKKNTDTDYTVYVAIMSSGLFFTEQHVKEIHCRFNGTNWLFDGYLPAEIVRYKKADKASFAYWMVQEKTIDQVLKEDQFVNKGSQTQSYDAKAFPDVWGLDGILFDNNQVKVKFTDSEIVSEGWDEYGQYQYVLEGHFETLTNQIKDIQRLKDKVYLINFEKDWSNLKEKGYETTYYGMEITSPCTWVWKEAVIPKKSYMLVALAGTSMDVLKGTLAEYGLDVERAGFYGWGYDDDFSWGPVHCMGRTTSIPVDTIYIVFDNKIKDIVFDKTVMAYPDTHYNIEFDWYTPVINDNKTIVPDGDAVKVPFYVSSLYGDCDSYDPELALLGSVLSSAAYSDGGKLGERIYNAYLSLGFESSNISLFSYPGHKNNESNVPGIDSNDNAVAFSIASKKAEYMEHGNAYYGSDSFRYTVMITVRGSADLGDWAKDLNGLPVMWQGVPTHCGFETAMIDVFSGLMYYLDKHPDIKTAIDQGKVDFFVTGHSLGGSVTNLLCATVLNKLRENGNKVFGYCFAPPKTIRTVDGLKIDGCDNIWNIIIPEDYFPTGYLTDNSEYPLVWGRYGTDRYVSCSEEYLTTNIKELFKPHHSYNYVKGVIKAAEPLLVSVDQQNHAGNSRIAEVVKYSREKEEYTWGLDSREVFQYDDSGLILERSIVPDWGEVKEKETYEYDSSGRLTKKTSSPYYANMDKFKQWIIPLVKDETMSFTYNEKGWPTDIERHFVRYGAGYYLNYVFSYSNEGRKATVKEYSSEDYSHNNHNMWADSPYSTGLTFDDNGALLERSETGSMGYWEKTEYKYDSAGRCISERYYANEAMGTPLTLRREILYSYNEQGYLDSETVTDEAGKKISFKFAYMWDDRFENKPTYMTFSVDRPGGTKWPEDLEWPEEKYWEYDENGNVVLCGATDDGKFGTETTYSYKNGRVESEINYKWNLVPDENGVVKQNRYDMTQTCYNYWD